VTFRPMLLASALITALVTLTPVQAAPVVYNWPQFDGNAQHTGDNINENVISTANVARLTQRFHVVLPDTADGAPVYVSNIPIDNQIHNVLFMTTRDGHLLAVDAQTGQTMWSQQRGPGTCVTNNADDGVPCYTTSSPAVDPTLQYVYSYGLDGYVHKFQIVDGKEIIDSHWPTLVTRKGFDEKASSALTIATAKSGETYLYVALAGYPGYAPDHQGDEGDYEGHIVTIDLSSGVQNIFNVVCSDQTVLFAEKPAQPDCASIQGAIWGRSGVVYDPETDKIYVATGNGDFIPSQNNWGDSVLMLNPDGTGLNGKPLDTYTPPTYQQDQQNDQDLGSSSPVILPAVTGSPIAHLGLQTGKDSLLRVLDLDNLSSDPDGAQPGNLDGALVSAKVPQGGEVHTQPVAWRNPADNSVWIFVTTETGGASGLRLAMVNGYLTLTPMWENHIGGASPLIANGVLYYAGENKTFYALDPLTGNQLWTAPIGSLHWESPIVANGWVYITDTDNYLTAFALPQ